MPLAARTRRWLLVLSVLALGLVLASWWVNRQLEPQRLAATVLGRVGAAQGLRIGFEGTPEYALRPEPRLLLPNLRVAGLEGEPFLTARRAEIALPWSTVTGDAPVLRIDGLRRWLATRPPEPFRVPTLTDGLQVTDGTVLGDGFALRRLALALPSLRQDGPAALRGSGRLERGDTRMDAQLELDLARAGLSSPYRLKLTGALQRDPKPLNFALEASGRFAYDEVLSKLDADALSLSGTSPLPRVTGRGLARSGRRLVLRFDGLLREWPALWPNLPEPLASQTRDLPVHLEYTGAKDLRDALALQVRKPPTTLDAQLRVAELQAWLAADAGPPLPPLAATLRTPVLEVEGITLEGVEATITPDAASARADGTAQGAP